MPATEQDTAAGSRRMETGDLILLVQATLDRTDALGRLVAEACTVTAKIVREPGGAVVASTRVSTVSDAADYGVAAPRAHYSALKRAAQDLADRIVAQLRRHLTQGTPARQAQPVSPGMGASLSGSPAGVCGAGALACGSFGSQEWLPHKPGGKPPWGRRR